MASWLLKTEPSTYSFADLVRDQRTTWDGVRNPVAVKHIGEMKVGDAIVVYHTGDEKAAVGLAEVASAPRVDPKDARLKVVDLVAKDALSAPVTLAEMKADAAFATSALVKQGRLSVVPLDAAQWKRITTGRKGSTR
jgi:predicted RNA-binding protein with PUA-like domain